MRNGVIRIPNLKRTTINISDLGFAKLELDFDYEERQRERELARELDNHRPGRQRRRGRR